MKNSKILAVTKKELAYFFHSPIAYVAVALFVVLTNWLFFSSFFLIDQASMRSFFQQVPLVYLLLAPALTMASFAEEKKSHTDEILFTLPLKESCVVAGKFLGAFLVLSLGLILTLTIPITLTFLGNPEWGPLVTSYLASLFLGGLFLSVGVFASSLSNNQIVGFVISAALCFLFYISGSNFVLQRVNGFSESVLRLGSAVTHFSNMSKGIVDIRDVVYFLSLTGMFLYLTVMKVKERD